MEKEMSLSYGNESIAEPVEKVNYNKLFWNSLIAPFRDLNPFQSIESLHKRALNRKLEDEKALSKKIEYMIENAKTHKDLDKIGKKLNYANDNRYNIPVIDYQISASKKMREIYNVFGAPVKGERAKVKREDLE